MNLEGHTHKVYGCCGYRHNYEGFYEKFTYKMFINKGEGPQLKVPMQAL